MESCTGEALQGNAVDGLEVEDFEVTIAPNGVATVCFNRPKVLNAFSFKVLQEIKQIFEHLSTNSEVKVAIIKGNGRCFSAGLDLGDVGESFMARVEEHGPDIARKGIEIHEYLTQCQDWISAVEKCRIPVVAAVHGYCLGAGVDLTSACDIRIASKSAKFAIREVEIGSIADWGTLQRFSKKVDNLSWFKELAYSARFFDADEAKKNGFVSKVCESDDALFEEANKLAETIAKKSPIAVVGSKLSMNYSLDHSVEDGLHHIRTLNSGLLQSDDVSIAAMAGLQKEVPKFAKL